MVDGLRPFCRAAFRGGCTVLILVLMVDGLRPEIEWAEDSREDWVLILVLMVDGLRPTSACASVGY